MRRFLIAIIAALLPVTGGIAGSAPPRLDASVHPGAPKPYDEAADGARMLDDAVARARQEHRLLLVDFGGNWCGDCRVLAGIMQLPDVSTWLQDHFVTVSIDVGRFTKNLDLARRWGVKLTAVPAVLVVRPDGTLANPNDTLSLSDARTMSEQAVVDKLASWAEP